MGDGGAEMYSLDIGGRELTLEFGQMAQQANGSTLVRYGDTACLVTAAMSEEPREGLDFFPLRVDYEERHYATGRIPGSFFRREGKPTEQAILACRLTDRPLRPLFPKGMRNDVQIIVTVLSFDPDHAPEICGMVGASTALHVSDIPFDGPVGTVNVGMIDGEVVLNPTEDHREKSPLDLTVAGTADAITMVEAGATEVSEDQVLEGIFSGHEEVKRLVRFQERLRRERGKSKREVTRFTVDDEVAQAVRASADSAMREAVMTDDKRAREQAVNEVKERVVGEVGERFDGQEDDIESVLKDLEGEEVRRGIVERQLRPDGRRPDEIRPVSCSVGMLPRAHGAGLFTRGETQALTVAALGPVGDRQILDSLGHDEDLKRYLHHYNFPPYSVGEVWPLRSPKRREIGHGALGERALLPMLPDADDFPYTIRVVSEILSSNGSTSQAAICGSSLALMDAGVPITRPVAGIAMGLVKEGDTVVTLTDIQGLEDHVGDMDFKVAGTRRGINALQMDIKIGGVSRAILEKALAEARKARLKILDKMEATISEPRADLSPYAPRIISMKIDPDKIGSVIGPGGKTINKIIDETGAEIDIEDDGTVFIASDDQAGGERAKEWVEELTADVEVGKIYKGKVVRVKDFGAFVEILPGTDGLVHISNLDDHHVPSVGDVVSEGDKILVKVTEIDDLDRVNLSREAALNEVENARDKEEIGD